MDKIQNPFVKIISNMKLPLILLIMIILTSHFGQDIPEYLKRFFLSISISIKEILLFILPVIIFAYLFSSIFTLKHKALKFIFISLSVIIFSNFISIIFSYSLGNFALQILSFTKVAIIKKNISLEPLWFSHFTPIISNKFALVLALVLGVYYTYIHSHKAETRSEELRLIVTTFLKRIFIPLVPLLIFGFILKLEHDGILAKLLKSYGLVLVYIFVVQVIYILIIFIIAAKLNFKIVAKTLAASFSPAIAGFSTMSSVTVMSVTIEAAERFSKKPERVNAFIPTASNIHLLGDNIAIAILSITILKIYNIQIPEFAEYVIFALYYTLAKFAVAGIPTGTIIVMLPVLRENLHFSNEMLSLITALYITFEPIFTSVNIYFNIGISLILSGTTSKKRVLKQNSSENLTFEQLRIELDKKNKLLREKNAADLVQFNVIKETTEPHIIKKVKAKSLKNKQHKYQKPRINE